MANRNNPAVKRIMGEMKELEKSPPEEFRAEPLEDNLFEWHFSVRGPRGTSFEGGTYHGKIVLPSEYPFKPPTITLLTPNGRFEVGKKICLSVSAHHPEHWQPAWGVRTIITALIAFMPSKADGALAGLDYTDEERKTLAVRSKSWRCAGGGPADDIWLRHLAELSAPPANDAAPPTPSPAVPSELRFGYEPSPKAAADQPSAGSSSASPAAPAQPVQAHSPAPAVATQPAGAPAPATSASASAPTPSATAAAQPAPPAQRLTQPQPTPRPEPPAGSKLVWVLAVAILALVVRKMLKGGCAGDEENLLDDALCKT